MPSTVGAGTGLNLHLGTKVLYGFHRNNILIIHSFVRCLSKFEVNRSSSLHQLVSLIRGRKCQVNKNKNNDDDDDDDDDDDAIIQ